MVLVFDIGATHIRVALVPDGELGDVIRMDTDHSAAGFAKAMGLVEEVTQGHTITAVAGGMAGQLEGEDGRLTMTPNLPLWQGVAVRREFRRLFECPIYILNDVVMGGLGECHYGAGRRTGVMAYFTVSTGVNAARIVDGRIDSTIARYEIGQHLIEEANGRARTLESLVGGAALEKRTGRKPRDIENERTWKAEERHLALGLYNVILDWTPEVVVLGGSMMRDINLRHLAHELNELPNALSRWPQLKRARLGDTAGLLGALEYLEQMAGDQPKR
jgi:predicted NBD/HSP70 family sugar kinase